MKLGKLLALAAGYAAGMVIALRFGKDGKAKNIDSLKKDIEDIHKNLWTEAEAAIFSEENKQKVAELRKQAEAEIAEFKKEAQTKLRNWKKLGDDKRKEVLAEVEALYARRVEILEEAKKTAIEAIDTGKETSEKAVAKLQKKTEKVAAELKKDLEKTFKDLKKKAKAKVAKK